MLFQYALNDSRRNFDNTMNAVERNGVAGVLATAENGGRAMTAIERTGAAAQMAADRNGTANALAVQNTSGAVLQSLERNGAAAVNSTDRNAASVIAAADRNGNQGELAIERNAGQIRDLLNRNSAEARGIALQAHADQMNAIKDTLLSAKTTDLFMAERARESDLINLGTRGMLEKQALELGALNARDHAMAVRDSLNGKAELMRQADGIAAASTRDILGARADIMLQASGNTATIQLEALKNKEDIGRKLDWQFNDLKEKIADSAMLQQQIDAYRVRDNQNDSRIENTILKEYGHHGHHGHHGHRHGHGDGDHIHNNLYSGHEHGHRHGRSRSPRRRSRSRSPIRVFSGPTGNSSASQSF